MAYFRDTEPSAGNSVQAGTLNLEFGGSATFTFDTALVPTNTTTSAVTLTSPGSLEGSLDIDVSYGESDAASNDTDVSADQVAQNLEVVTLEYPSNNNISDQISMSNSPPTLADLATNEHGSEEATQNDLINLDDPGQGGTEFKIGLRLKDVGNEYQSDGVSIDFTFRLNQNEEQ